MALEQLPDTWLTRDLPVLRAVAKSIESGTTGGARVAQLAEETGLEPDDVVKALLALEGDTLIDVVWMMPANRASRVPRISGQARRLVGLWPTPESGLVRLISALEVIAAQPSNPAKPQADQALDAFKAAGSAFLPAVTAITGDA